MEKHEYWKNLFQDIGTVLKMASTPSDKGSLNTSGLILPAYVILRPEGVFINLSPPPAQDVLQPFVDRLFSNETRFAGLDYARFIHLLYGDDSSVPPSDGSADTASDLPDSGVTDIASPPEAAVSEVRIASGIVRFPQDRMELYKGVRIMGDGERAEYMFEPTFIEVEKDEPIDGEPDEEGVMPEVEYQHVVERQPVQLDFDEFVASMWVKGVHFGIDADAVRDAIEKNAPMRLNIAHQLEPTDSKDAEAVEVSQTLHQDNAPLILANGMADLHRAKNHFPQVAKDLPLLRKAPRALGKPGYRVTGTVIEPRMPKDMDLGALAGEGTRIVQSPKGELLVANLDGFVVFDESTGKVCVTEIIEDKGGISTKLTGDISLSVDEFIEHGEVQQGCIVEGKHITFRADVYGTVISQGGNIDLDSNLSGGHAQSVGGNITVKGKIISATLEAWDGNISAEFAEESLIIGKHVAVVRAVNCEIVAEELQLGIAEGCAIAGKQLQIASSNAHKNRETIISILLPDIADYDRQIAEAKASLAQVEQDIQARNHEIAAHQSDPRVAKYIAMAEKVRAGEIKFTPEQQAGWQKLVHQFAPIVKSTETLMNKCMALEEGIEQLTQARATCGAGEYCKIEEVSGETVVRKISTNYGMSAFRDLPQQELRIQLQQLGDVQERIFSGDNGNLDWHFTIPDL